MTDTVEKTAPINIDLSNCSGSNNGGKTTTSISELISQTNSNANSLLEVQEIKTATSEMENSVEAAQDLIEEFGKRLDQLDEFNSNDFVKKTEAFKGNGYLPLTVDNSFMGPLPTSSAGISYLFLGYTLNDNKVAVGNKKSTAINIPFYTYSASEQLGYISFWNNSNKDDTVATCTFKAKAIQPNADGVCNLGANGVAWNNIYSKTSVTVTSDKNLKTLVDVPNLADILYKNLNMCNYKLNAELKNKGDKARIHTGFIAQDVKNILQQQGIDPSTVAMWLSAPNETTTLDIDDNGRIKKEKLIDDESVEEIQSLRYEELLCALFQGMKNKINLLEEELLSLKKKLEG